jgi:hypothetical protein
MFVNGRIDYLFCHFVFLFASTPYTNGRGF